MRKSWSAILALVAIGVILLLVLRRHNRGAYPTTVIPGTWTWDVDSNSLGSGSYSDFFWEQIDATNRNLVPKNGAVAAVAAAKDFDGVDESFARRQQLSSAKISGSDRNAELMPGSIVVFRTSQGRYGKLQVIRFRAIDDFGFPEASRLSQQWRDFATTEFKLKPPRGNVVEEIVFRVKRLFRRDFPRNYHLEVKWQLFQSQSNYVGPANGSQPIRSETNSTSSEAGSRR